MLRKTMIVLATAAALTGGLTAESFARGGGGGGHGGGFGDGGGAHIGGGFGAFPDRIPSVSPHLNSFSPHTLPQSREPRFASKSRVGIWFKPWRNRLSLSGRP